MPRPAASSRRPIVLWDALRGVALPFWFAAGSRGTRGRLAAGRPRRRRARRSWPAVFPWKLGYAQAGWPWLVQSADLFGPEFTTFVLFAHAGAIVWGVEAVGLAPSCGPRRGVAGGGGGDLPAQRGLRRGRPGLVGGAASTGRRVQRHARAGRSRGDGRHRAAAAADRGARRGRRRRPTSSAGRNAARGEFDARLDSVADSGPRGPALAAGCAGRAAAGRPRRAAALRRPRLRGLRRAAAGPLPVGPARGRRRGDPRPLPQAAPDALRRIRAAAGIWPELRRRFPMVADFTAGTAATVLDTAAAAARRDALLRGHGAGGGAVARARSANVLVALVNGAAFTAPHAPPAPAARPAPGGGMPPQPRAVRRDRGDVRDLAAGHDRVRPAAARPGALDATVPLLDGLTLASRSGPAFPAACGVAAAALAAARWRRGSAARLRSLAPVRPVRRAARR